MTLSFSWATNANYSSGPDTGTATKVDPASTANGFIKGVIAAPQHVNFLFDAVGDQLVRAVDGVGGGTYTLGSNLVFDGVGEVRYAGVVRVVSGADLNIDAGGEINITGDLDVLSGGDVNFESGSDLIMGSGSLLTVATGADLLLDGDAAANGTVLLNSGALLVLDGAQAFVDAAQDIVVSNQTRTFRLGMTPTWIEQVSGANGWDMIGSPGTWVQVDVAAQRLIMFPLALPSGDTVDSITVTADGTSAGGPGHGTIPATGDRLTVRLVSVALDGTVTTHATLADTAANAAAYDVSHSFTMSSISVTTGSMPQTIAAAETYYVMIEGEAGGNAVANTLGVTSIVGSYVSRSFTGSGTVTHLP